MPVCKSSVEKIQLTASLLAGTILRQDPMGGTVGYDQLANTHVGACLHLSTQQRKMRSCWHSGRLLVFFLVDANMRGGHTTRGTFTASGPEMAAGFDILHSHKHCLGFFFSFLMSQSESGLAGRRGNYRVLIVCHYS